MPTLSVKLSDKPLSLLHTLCVSVLFTFAWLGFWFVPSCDGVGMMYANSSGVQTSNITKAGERTHNYFDELQEAKERISYFADGSSTPEAKAASVLWLLIDTAQTSPDALEPLNQNPRLIPAAPAMLESLKGLFQHCSMIHKHWGEGCNQKEADAAVAAARNAIARAEGRIN